MSLGDLNNTKPAARLRAATSQTIASNTDTYLVFDFIEFDTVGNIADLSTNRLTAPRGGIYYASAAVRWWGAPQTGERYLAIQRNGNDADRLGESNRDFTLQVGGSSVSGPIRLAKGDFINAYVFQSTGVDQTTAADLGDISLQMCWIGPA